MRKGSPCSLADEGQVWDRPLATLAPRGTAITTTISTVVVLKQFKASAMRFTMAMMGTVMDTATLCLITQV